jgi:hypothetical protein
LAGGAASRLSTRGCRRGAGDGYSASGIGNRTGKLIGDFPILSNYVNQPLCCVTIPFKPKVLVSSRNFQILWLAIGLMENNKRAFEARWYSSFTLGLLFSAV